MPGKTVLIVDDDPDQHTICEAYLRHAGYSVLHAYDGEEGVEVARRARPDVILMDRRMPRLDGLEALRRLTEREETRGIPVVALSADVLEWNESRALQEGFAAHIAKPTDLRRILSLVQRLIGGPEAAATLAGGVLL
ncbi:MAG TPA: response regulator [Longimicrobiaceae bacterium]|nr:response regulator [Longimicrobiaceae bacterium]